MAKITNSAREDFNDKVKPYKDEIDKILAKEKNILSTMDRDSDNAAYKRILLAEDMIYVATVYLTMSNLSLEILSTKNTDSLNESRKALYKAIIYLEEVVTDGNKQDSLDGMNLPPISEDDMNWLIKQPFMKDYKYEGIS